jgi:hypothetical protein
VTLYSRANGITLGGAAQPATVSQFHTTHLLTVCRLYIHIKCHSEHENTSYPLNTSAHRPLSSYVTGRQYNALRTYCNTDVKLTTQDVKEKISCERYIVAGSRVERHSDLSQKSEVVYFVVFGLFLLDRLMYGSSRVRRRVQTGGRWNW